MKPAFQKDEILLADIRAALAAGTTKLWWLGQSGFLVVRGGRALVFDPYLSDSLTEKYRNTDKPHERVTERVLDPAALGALGCIDLVTSSHNHTDHLDAATLVPILDANPRARLAVPAANRDFVLERLGGARAPRIIEMDDGVPARIAHIELHGVAAAHNTVERDDHGRCRFLGYVAQWGGLSIYHSGDTKLHGALVPALTPYRVDLALLPINGDRPERRVAGNLDGPEAAQLARDIGAKCVVPCHYDLFAFNTATTDDFETACRRLGQPYRVLRNGEGMEIAS